MEASTRRIGSKVSKEIKFNETIYRTSLKTSNSSDQFVKELDKLYGELVTTPHFNDEEVVLEEIGISFFHKETKEELAALIMTCLSFYINQTGHQVSHVIENNELKTYATVIENLSLGKSFMVTRNALGITEVIENEEKE